MCSSLKGHLRSRFIVLSDDRDPPPPPVRGKRGRPDEGSDPNVGGKRFQARSSTAVPEIVTRAQVNQPAQQDRAAPEAAQPPDVSVVGVGPPANTSTPFEPVKNRRSRRLPAGVRALPIPTRTTPDRQAKGSKVRVAGQPQAGSQSQSQPMPDPDAINGINGNSVLVLIFGAHTSISLLIYCIFYILCILQVLGTLSDCVSIYQWTWQSNHCHGEESQYATYWWRCCTLL